VHGTLFMANQDMLNLLLLEQSIINVQNGATGIAEYSFYPFSFQAFHQDLTTGQFHERSLLFFY
jgi:hypothetical protein